MRIILVTAIFFTAGCSYIDWGGVWFGCPEGQRKHPARYSMFGRVTAPSHCEPTPPAKEQP